EMIQTATGVGTGLAVGLTPDRVVAATLARAAAETMHGVPFEKRDVARVGFIGVGGRGSSLLGDLLVLDGVEVRAICDLVKDRADNAATRTEKAGQKRPEVYGGAETIFKKLCERDDLDIVYIATPWNWHVPMAVDAMEHGKHAAV